MKLTISLALLAMAATHVAAVIPIPIPECTKTVIVKSTDTCDEMAESYGITFKDMLAWNEKLRKDCMNLDDNEPICVSVSPGGVNPTREPKAHKAKEVAKAPESKAHKAKEVAKAPESKAHKAKEVAKAPKPKAQAASKPVAPVAHGPAKVSRIEGNPEIQVESEDPSPEIQVESEDFSPKIASLSSNAKGGSLHRTNAATTVSYATFSVVGAALVSLALVL